MSPLNRRRRLVYNCNYAYILFILVYVIVDLHTSIFITEVNVLYHKGTNNQTDSGSTEFTKMDYD